MSALRPVDLTEVRTKATAWKQNHALCRVLELSRARRIRDGGAKACYIMETMAGCNTSGSQPCDACGAWTHAFCETCSASDPARPPFAVCTACDADGILCSWCLSHGFDWDQSQIWRSQSTTEDVLEITGLTQEDGTFHRFTTPMVLPLSEVERDADGNVILASVMQRVNMRRSAEESTS